MIAKFKNIPMIVKFYHSEPLPPKYDFLSSTDYRVCTCYIRIGVNAPSTFKCLLHSMNRNMPLGKNDVLGVGGYILFQTENVPYVKSTARGNALEKAICNFRKTLDKMGFEYTQNDIQDFIKQISTQTNLF